MELYRRNISISLSIHRLLILLIILTAVYLVYEKMADYAWFCLIIVLVFLPFPLTCIIVKEQAILIRKYFFGFVRFSYPFSLDDNKRTIISINEVEVETNSATINTGTFLDLFVLFSPRKMVVEKYLLIYNYHEANKKLHVKLTEEEHQLILKFIHQRKEKVIQ